MSSSGKGFRKSALPRSLVSRVAGSAPVIYVSRAKPVPIYNLTLQDLLILGCCPNIQRRMFLSFRTLVDGTLGIWLFFPRIPECHIATCPKLLFKIKCMLG